MSNPVPYLEKLPARAHRFDRLAEIDAAIERDGFWQETVEWRIMTETTLRIQLEESDGKRWYGVSVKCDAEMTCRCPTLSRAVEFLGTFEMLTIDLFWTFGWPSWVSLRQLDL
jgi:hypothetical protein